MRACQAERREEVAYLSCPADRQCGGEALSVTNGRSPSPGVVGLAGILSVCLCSSTKNREVPIPTSHWRRRHSYFSHVTDDAKSVPLLAARIMLCVFKAWSLERPRSARHQHVCFSVVGLPHCSDTVVVRRPIVLYVVCISCITVCTTLPCLPSVGAAEAW